MSKKKLNPVEAARDEAVAEAYNPVTRGWWQKYRKKHPEEAAQIIEVIRDYREGRSALVSVQSAARFIKHFFPSVPVSYDAIARIDEWKK